MVLGEPNIYHDSGVYYKYAGFYLEGVWLWRISWGYSQEMMGLVLGDSFLYYWFVGFTEKFKCKKWEYFYYYHQNKKLLPQNLPPKFTGSKRIVLYTIEITKFNNLVFTISYDI